MPDETADPTGEPQETKEAKDEGKARGGPSTPPEPGGGRSEDGSTDEDAA